ncbi:MAG: aminopeptidase P family protein [Clostridia bacterium]|nr:aminopeptidase P family protein [Clostridia bacterium]
MTQLSRFQSALASTDADAAIISSELNIRYLCGFDYTDGYLLIFPHKAYLLADFRYIEAARACVKDFEVIMPDCDMLTALYELLRQGGALTVSIEDASLSCAQFTKMSEKMSGITLATGASEMLRTQRAVKLPYELELIDKAQRITDAAFEHILGFISPSVTERDVALELEFFMRRMGAESTAFDTIAVSGKSSSLPHGVPADKKLSHGFLTMDFGAKYMGYCSDMTRTVVIGKADDEMKKVYNTVLSAQRAALEKIHERILCREADRIARDIITDAGFGKCFGHSLGHGVGMYIHESPSLSQRADGDSVLCRGNVVTVEPGIYLEGKYGCRIEDMIAIDESGNVLNFTQSPKELLEL